MKLLTLFSLLAPAMTSVQATCYASGPNWSPSANRASQFVDNVCKSGGLAGWFPEGQTKYRCVNLHDGLKGEFWVRWEGRGGHTLADADCKFRLKNEINGCPKGGYNVNSGWFFRSDANGGSC